jgi:hypothetical protein
VTNPDVPAELLAVTDAFLTTFNTKDVPGHADTLAYPHVRLASGSVRIWADRDEAVAAMTGTHELLHERTGWTHSRWDHRRLIHNREDKAHLDVQFTRYRADESIVGVYPAIYVLVSTPNGWRIQARSSFAP